MNNTVDFTVIDAHLRVDVQVASLFWKHVGQGKLQQVKQHTEQQLSQEYAALCTVAYSTPSILPCLHHIM